jgi:hypothetical protein
MSTLIDVVSAGLEERPFHCHADATLSDASIDLYVKVTDENKQLIAELKMQGTASNPFVILGSVLHALGHYGLCVGFKITRPLSGLRTKGIINRRPQIRKMTLGIISSRPTTS